MLELVFDNNVGRKPGGEVRVEGEQFLERNTSKISNISWSPSISWRGRSS